MTLSDTDLELFIYVYQILYVELVRFALHDDWQRQLRKKLSLVALLRDLSLHRVYLVIEVPERNKFA